MYLFKLMKRLVKKKKQKLRRRQQLRKRNSLKSPADSGGELNHTLSASSSHASVGSRSSKDLSPLASLTSSPSSCFQETEQPESGYTSAQELQVSAEIEQEVSLSSISYEQLLVSADYGRNVQLVELRLSDSKLSGRVMVKNLAYHKNIFIRWTSDNWASYQDLAASYDDSSEGFTHDWFTFSTESPLRKKGDQEDGVSVKLAVAYQVNWMEFWDNNQGNNFEVVLE